MTNSSLTVNVIHLPHRTDRMELLMQEFTSQGITNYRIWDGIIDPENTIRGISKAHKQIVLDAKSRVLPFVLIAEDDVKFLGKDCFEYFIKNIPDSFDLYLGGIIWGKVKADYTVEDFAGTMLYIVHNAFYDTVLNGDETIDFDRSLARKGVFKVCNPMIVSQHNGYSDNQKRLLEFY